jgi:hypothetical protein
MRVTVPARERVLWRLQEGERTAEARVRFRTMRAAIPGQ